MISDDELDKRNRQILYLHTFYTFIAKYWEIENELNMMNMNKWNGEMKRWNWFFEQLYWIEFFEKNQGKTKKASGEMKWTQSNDM